MKFNKYLPMETREFLEKQYKKFGSMLKSKKMRKAKELESESNFNFDHD